MSLRHCELSWAGEHTGLALVMESAEDRSISADPTRGDGKSRTKDVLVPRLSNLV